MNVFTVEILDARGRKKLQELASRNWILLQKSGPDDFLNLLEVLRKKASRVPPTLKLITEEVEKVRRERYAKKKAKGNR